MMGAKPSSELANFTRTSWCWTSKVEPGVQILLCTVQLSTYVVKEAEKMGIPGAVSKSKVSQITEGIAALLRHERFYCWPNN